MVETKAIPTVGQRYDMLIDEIGWLMKKAWRLGIFESQEDFADEIKEHVDRWLAEQTEPGRCCGLIGHCICP